MIRFLKALLLLPIAIVVILLAVANRAPVLLSFETYRQTFHYIRESSLPAPDIDKILNHNAQTLLGLAP